MGEFWDYPGGKLGGIFGGILGSQNTSFLLTNLPIRSQIRPLQQETKNAVLLNLKSMKRLWRPSPQRFWVGILTRSERRPVGHTLPDLPQPTRAYQAPPYPTRPQQTLPIHDTDPPRTPDASQYRPLGVSWVDHWAIQDDSESFRELLRADSLNSRADPAPWGHPSAILCRSKDDSGSIRDRFWADTNGRRFNQFNSSTQTRLEPESSDIISLILTFSNTEFLVFSIRRPNLALDWWGR